MNNPLKNTSYINHLKLVGLLLIILFMFFLTYLLIWNPYSLYFNRPEFSATPSDRRELFSGLAAFTNFILLVGLTVFSIIKFWRKRKFIIWTPLAGILTLLILMRMMTLFPDSHFEYTKDGYRYLEQKWHKDNEVVFKRFKSEKPINSYSNHRTIVWELDSISK